MRNVVKYPLQLGRRKVSVGNKPRLFVNEIALFAFKFFAVVRRSAALPHNGVIDGLARLFVPDKRCFALVGNANRRDVLRRDIGAHDSLRNDRHNRTHYVLRGMFHISRLGIYLLELLLSH